MIDEATLWSLPTNLINHRAVIYRALLIFVSHYGYVPDRIGRVDGDVTNDKIENLYDVSFGKPATDPFPVRNDRMYEIIRRYPLVSKRELAVLRRPLPDHVRNETIDIFRTHGVFVPIDDVVVDKRTGGIKLRRYVVERLVADGDVCYDKECYKLTLPAT